MSGEKERVEVRERRRKENVGERKGGESRREIYSKKREVLNN